MDNKNKAIAIGVGALALGGIAYAIYKATRGSTPPPPDHTCSDPNQYWNGTECVDKPIDPTIPIECELGYHPNEDNTACVPDMVAGAYNWSSKGFGINSASVEPDAYGAHNAIVNIEAPFTPSLFYTAPTGYQEICTRSANFESLGPEIYFNVQFAFGHIIDLADYIGYGTYHDVMTVEENGGVWSQGSLSADPTIKKNEVYKFGNKIFYPENFMAGEYPQSPNYIRAWHCVYGLTEGYMTYWSRLLRIDKSLYGAGDFIRPYITWGTSFPDTPNPIATQFFIHPWYRGSTNVQIWNPVTGQYEDEPGTYLGSDYLDMAVIIVEETAKPGDEWNRNGPLWVRGYRLIPNVAKLGNRDVYTQPLAGVTSRPPNAVLYKNNM